MFKPKRLHPIAIVTNARKTIKDVLFPFIAFLFIGHKGMGGTFFFIIALIGSILFILVTSFLSWFRHTYHLEEEELRIEYGIFIRKKRYIPFERIQSLNISEGILQRIFGVVKVQIETAGGKPAEGAEADLSAISKKEAQYIQGVITKVKRPSSLSTELEESKKNQSVFQITTAQLLLLSFTSGGVGVVISAVLTFLSQLDDFIPYKRLFGGFEKLAAGSMFFVAFLVFMGFLLAWLLALIGMMVKYAHFTVSKTEHDLIISQGLLERRQITIPLNRIQAVRISENIIRQMLGFATVYIESAGGSASNTEGSRVMLIPIVKREQIPLIINPYLTDYNITLLLNQAPKRALIRYMLRSWFISIPIVIVSLIIFKTWGALSLILLAVATFWSLLKYRDAGWGLENQQLSLRYRTINRNTIIMKKNRIQSLKVRESFFQRRMDLTTIETFIKSGIGGSGGRVTDLAKADIEKIYFWYAN